VMDGWRGSWRGRRRRGHAQLSINRLARLRAGEVGQSRGWGGRGMSSAGPGSELLDGSLLCGGAIVGGGRHARGAPVRPRRSRDRRRRRGLRRARPRRRVVVLLWLWVVVHGDCAMTGAPYTNVSKCLLELCGVRVWERASSCQPSSPSLCSFLPKIASDPPVNQASCQLIQASFLRHSCNFTSSAHTL
jgi:hypothetical protein